MTKTDVADPRDEILEHIGALRAFARSLCRDATLADDLVQDTMVKAITNFDKFEQGTNMRAWLFTILRNTFYSNRRKAGREISDTEGTMTDQLSVKPDHDGRLQYAEFTRAFARLSPEQREVLILVGASGFSYEEAAEMCGVAVGTIKSRTNRARKQLAEMMGLTEARQVDITDLPTKAVLSSGAL